LVSGFGATGTVVIGAGGTITDGTEIGSGLAVVVVDDDGGTQTGW
jgi:hypothetical protein